MSIAARPMRCAVAFAYESSVAKSRLCQRRQSVVLSQGLNREDFGIRGFLVAHAINIINGGSLLFPSVVMGDPVDHGHD